MKPALVLGLAIAANAMVADQGDSELFVAPHGKFDRDIAQRFPGKIMYDEVADDELAVRQKVIHGFPESFAAADDELALKIVHRPHVPVTEPAAFDDHEFARKSKGDSNRDKEVVSRLGYVNPASFFDEVADDELAMKFVHRPIAPAPEFASFDDHEFARKSKGDSNRDKEVVSRLGYVNPASFFDEVADDELLVSPPRDMTRYGFDEHGRVLRDNIGRPVKPVLHRFDDDELAVRPGTLKNTTRRPDVMRPAAVRPITLPSGEKAWTAWDDDELAVRQKVIHGFPESFAADDDELAYKLVIPRPHVPVTEPAAFDDHEFARKSKGDSNRDKEVVSRLGYVNPASFFDEVADDELAYKLVIPRPHVPITEPAAFDDHEFARKSKGDSNRDKEVVSRLGYVNPASFFDEADDELAYLGQLIRDGGFIPRLYADDELRAEKPSHIKAEERTQSKSELPKKQRKLRPHPDVIPMTEN